MYLLRKVCIAAIAGCLFTSAVSAEERCSLFTKPYYSRTEKDHVLYDVLHEEKLFFSSIDMFSISDCDGSYDDEYERAFAYYKQITRGRRVTRANYHYYVKLVADYLYNLLFGQDQETVAAGGTTTTTTTTPASSGFSDDFATLLIGIDYEGTSNALSNCIHDVEHVLEKLLVPKMGVKESSVILMTDHQKGDLYPTKENIRKQFKKFASRLNYARKGYFHYSGHGTYMWDDDNDEADRKDEALCPVDCSYNGMIRDDELFEDFICELSHDVKLVMTTDCCHSGSIMDLPYKWDTSGGYELQQKKLSHTDLEALADVVMISGCKDDQTSADGGFMKDDTKGSGAMTAAYLETLRHYDFNLTYRQLIDKMHELLISHGYRQRPVLSSTRKINLDDYFMTTRAAVRP